MTWAVLINKEMAMMMGDCSLSGIKPLQEPSGPLPAGLVCGGNQSYFYNFPWGPSEKWKHWGILIYLAWIRSKRCTASLEATRSLWKGLLMIFYNIEFMYNYFQPSGIKTFTKRSFTCRKALRVLGPPRIKLSKLPEIFQPPALLLPPPPKVWGSK